MAFGGPVLTGGWGAVPFMGWGDLSGTKGMQIKKP